MPLTIESQRSAQAEADKQLDTMYKATKTLTELGHVKFVHQIKHHGFAFRWHPSLYDLSVPGYTAESEQQQALADDENASTSTKKAFLDQRNALMIITKFCEGHEVEHLHQLVSLWVMLVRPWKSSTTTLPRALLLAHKISI